MNRWRWCVLGLNLRRMCDVKRRRTSIVGEPNVFPCQGTELAIARAQQSLDAEVLEKSLLRIRPMRTMKQGLQGMSVAGCSDCCGGGMWDAVAAVYSRATASHVPMYRLSFAQSLWRKRPLACDACAKVGEQHDCDDSRAFGKTPASCPTIGGYRALTRKLNQSILSSSFQLS